MTGTDVAQMVANEFLIFGKYTSRCVALEILNNTKEEKKEKYQDPHLDRKICLKWR